MTKSIRLNSYDRSAIANRAIEAGFDVRETALAEEENEVGLAAYNHLIPEAERVVVAALPARWVRSDMYFRTVFGFKTTTIRLTQDVRLPNAPMGTVTDQDIIARFDRLEGRKADFKAEKERTRKTLDAMLSGISTLKKLYEVWPEGAPFYETLGERPINTLPAVQIDELNKTLGLVRSDV